MPSSKEGSDEEINASGSHRESPDSRKENSDQSGNISDGSTGSESSTGSSGGTPFRMEVKQANRKRKRIHPAATASADVLGGGADDEEESAGQKQQQQPLLQPQRQQPQHRAQSPQGHSFRTASPSGESKIKQEPVRSSPSSLKREKIQQPDGWRVKLYRLNADGSWDDCGTGRVLCLYRPSMAKANASSPVPRSSPPPFSSGGHQSSAPPYNAALDSWICQELGEPTLCMHAELVSGSTQPRILLRTRILLRDAYQRQGDNIITWCEPYYDSNSNSSASNENGNSNSSNSNGNGETSGGVDLALSFQDNAGCLNIWKQITHVQRRAAELYRTHHHPSAQSPTQPQESSGDDRHQTVADSPDANNSIHRQSRGALNENDTKAANSQGSMTDMAQKVAAEHHAELERQQQHQMWVSMAETVQSSSPNNTYPEGGDSGGPLSQHQSNQNATQHNAQHQAHHHARGISNSNSSNRQQQSQGDSQQQQQQHIQFVSAEDGGGELSSYGSSGASSPNHQQEQVNLSNNQNNPMLQPQLPNPPMLSKLEDIADTIARVQHIQQRESLAMFISQNECSYLKSLLSLFPAAEDRGDYGSLATLAACVKTILLLNDPSIIELIVSDEAIFEQICATLEYDPDLRDKANHRWFLRERARFRTVVLMEDEELIESIHRAFRVNYLKDTLLRPTMDESSLSTLSSLQTFTHSDVVKGVTMTPPSPRFNSSASSTEGGQGHHNEHGNHHDEDKDGSERDSYLVRVIRMLGVELHALCHMEWAELEANPVGTRFPDVEEMPGDPSIVVPSVKFPESEKLPGTWKQHLAPQDGSLASRRIRRRGCLTFLRELFNMVRISLQQNDKDNFFSVIVSMEIDVIGGEDTEKGGKISDNESQTSKIVEVGSVAASEKSERFDEKPDTNLSQHMGLEFMPLSSPVNLLSLLGTVLSDPNTDVTEKGLVLEIIAGVAMHDPGLIRRHCLEFHSSWKRTKNSSQQERDVSGLGRPEANEKKQVIFLCPPNDLLAALLFLLDTEIDAGILLQVSEIMRIILDTDMMGEHGPMGGGFSEDTEPGVFPNEADSLPAGGVQSQPHGEHNQMNNGGSTATTTEQKQFLSMFYEHFIDWVVAPFQFTILHPVRRVPDSVLISPSESPLLMQMMKAFKNGVTHDDGLFRIIPRSAIRTSFAVELLSFCVRAHLYRMKIFLLKSRVLSNVLKLLSPQKGMDCSSGDRSLKLAALRFLRAILSVNDEFYHRHIIHHDLFAPVFEAFRANPVGDNLVSSAIVEMCDFIHNESIMSLMEYIVTKHLSADPEKSLPSLEDVSSPYVSTLTTLRRTYEQNLEATKQQQGNGGPIPATESPTQQNNSRYFSGNAVAQGQRVLSGKALEEQRKFHEEHEEESYFEADDDEGQPEPPPTNTAVPPAVDEVAAQEEQGEADLHRTARMFSLAQSPLINHMEESENKEAHMHQQHFCDNKEVQMHDHQQHQQNQQQHQHEQPSEPHGNATSGPEPMDTEEEKR